MTSPTPSSSAEATSAGVPDESAKPPAPKPRQSPQARLLAALFALGVVLTATVVPGVFIVDDDNYLATVIGLRRGDFSLPGTEGLPPSLDLYWFDPWPHGRGAPSTPVVSVAPPLYAFLALPFSYLGFRGLIALNTLAFLIATWLVFRLTERYTTSPKAPWLAAFAFAFGSFNIEYAQGMWPHMLSVALCLGAFALASDVRAGRPLLLAAGAGLLAGLATGVRYQNIVFAAFLGLGLLLFAKRRWLASTLYGIGASLPLAASSFINHARFGSWNPVSKGTSYTKLATVQGETQTLLDVPRAFFSKLVDFRAQPPIGTGEPGTWSWRPDDNGAFIFLGTVKKALLQSSPWIAVALGLALAAWFWRGLEPEKRREMRAMSLLFAAVLGLFALAGLRRHDGLCFNQRYLLELVPLSAVALGFGFDRLKPSLRPLAIGAGLAAVVAGVTLLAEPGSWLRTTLLMNAPLLLAGGLLVAWALAMGGKIAARLPWALLGACMIWSMAAQVDDHRAARRIRARNADRLEAYSQFIPENVAFFSYWGNKDALGPLLLDRDFVLVDPNYTQGRDTFMLIDAFLERGTRVLLDVHNYPRNQLRAILERHPYREVAPGRFPVIELGPALGP